MRKLLLSGTVLLLLHSQCEAADKWETWENCRLIPNDANDGDSFHVRKDGGNYTYILRLYFVDAAETDRSLEERMQDQADYWGISAADIYTLGKEATKFTAVFLKDNFTVYTRKQDAMGRSAKNRYFALIEVEGSFLSDALMKEGLARLYGVQVDPPPGVPSISRFRLRLKGSEKEAKQSSRGAWGLTQADPKLPQTSSLYTPAPRKVSTQELPDQIHIVQAVHVYSSIHPEKTVGTLTSGMTVILLDEPVNQMVRVRFTTQSGKTYEAMLRDQDLRKQL